MIFYFQMHCKSAQINQRIINQMCFLFSFSPEWLRGRVIPLKLSQWLPMTDTFLRLFWSLDFYFTFLSLLWNLEFYFTFLSLLYILKDILQIEVDVIFLSLLWNLDFYFIFMRLLYVLEVVLRSLSFFPKLRFILYFTIKKFCKRNATLNKIWRIQIQIIYYKSVSYTWYFLNRKWYKQTTNYFTQKKIIQLNTNILKPIDSPKISTIKKRNSFK
jgi:hypothetical protein